MKPALQARLGTQLALTPQLRQAIRLLQLSQVELEAELQAAIESNPLLELIEPGSDSDTGESGAGDENGDAASDTAADDAEHDASDDGDDWSLDDGVARSQGEDDDDRDDLSGASNEGLHAHLLWQLRMSVHNERDEAIGEAIIDALDEDGYLREPLESLPASLPELAPLDAGEVRAVLRLVQQFDPLGCGAADLSECLGLQLSALAADTPGLALAQQLARRHLDAVARQKPERIALELERDGNEVLEAIALLKSLDPKPGSRFSSSTAEYVQPDATVFRHRGVWRIRMTRSSASRLGLNSHYQSLIGHCSRDDDNYLRGQLQEARWLLKALENRADTLQRVAEAIVRTQSAFLDHGLEAMRPLTLREVAEQLGLHESTISRATTRKYLRTPRGSFEFKFFFSSGVATDHGGAASSTAIQAMLRKMIEAEPLGRPLSDQALADALKADGIAIARRTVAKYREGLGIPPSSERGQR